MLVALEPLIASGFNTRRRRLVNISVETWNDTFGKLESLRYPPRLELAVQRLVKIVDLSLPSFQTHDDDTVRHPQCPWRHMRLMMRIGQPNLLLSL